MTEKGRSATVHMCAALDEDDKDSFLVPTCTCGWKGEPVPGVEDAVDSLMDHAREQTLIEGDA